MIGRERDLLEYALTQPRSARHVRHLVVVAPITRDDPRRLNLHCNAVAYRINRAFELLEVYQDSPDDLLLQLACRARELAQI